MDHTVEKEAKFLIADLQKLEERVQNLGGVKVQERVFEKNLRFDTASRDLSQAHQVLRLRQDNRARLTFKGPADPGSAVSERTEFEVEVSHLEKTAQILKALGYAVITVYEKFRTSYLLMDCEISLDEMPFGSFAEIEGPKEKIIKAAADKLGLDWEQRSSLSYLRLFAQVKEKRNLSMRDLSFEAFTGLEILPDTLGLEIAD